MFADITEEGLKKITQWVEETQSEELGRRAARKATDADLASGATTLQQKVVEQGITFVSPEQQAALGDDAPAPSWRVEPPPQQVAEEAAAAPSACCATATVSSIGSRMSE